MIKAANATLEDLQKFPTSDGILTTQHLIEVRIPLSWIYFPEVGLGITTTSTNNSVLASIILGAVHTVIIEVKKKFGILQFTVADAYLRIFLEDLKLLDGAFLTIGG